MVLGIVTAGAVMNAGHAAHGGSFRAGLTYLAAGGLSLLGALVTLAAREAGAGRAPAQSGRVS